MFNHEINNSIVNWTFFKNANSDKNKFFAKKKKKV